MQQTNTRPPYEERPTDFLPGDVVKTISDRHEASTTGTVKRVGRVNLTLEVPYMNGMTLEIKVRRDRVERRVRPDENCKHPPSRVYSWFAWNHVTGKKDIFCAGCCVCGEVLAGGAE